MCPQGIQHLAPEQEAHGLAREQVDAGYVPVGVAQGLGPKGVGAEDFLKNISSGPITKFCK
jgi:hypothetical protein